MSNSLLTEEESGWFVGLLMLSLWIWMWHKGAFTPSTVTTKAGEVKKIYKPDNCANCHKHDSRGVWERSFDSVIDAVQKKYWDTLYAIDEMKKSTSEFIDGVGRGLDYIGRSVERQFEEDTAALGEKINQALEYADSILAGLW